MSKIGRTAAKNRHEYRGGEEEEETELINAFEQFPPPACPLLRFSALALPPEATYHNIRSSRAKSEAAQRRRWTPRAPVFFFAEMFFFVPPEGQDSERERLLSKKRPVHPRAPNVRTFNPAGKPGLDAATPRSTLPRFVMDVRGRKQSRGMQVVDERRRARTFWGLTENSPSWASTARDGLCKCP